MPRAAIRPPGPRPRERPTRGASNRESATYPAASAAAMRALLAAVSSSRTIWMLAAIGTPMLQRGSACENSVVIACFVLRLPCRPRIPLPPSFRVCANPGSSLKPEFKCGSIFNR